MFLTSNFVIESFDLTAQSVGKKLNPAARFDVAAILGDAAISITVLVIGILSLMGILNGLPPAGSYAFFAVSGVITLTWIFLAIKTKGEIFCFAKDLLLASVSPNPKL